MIKKRFSEVHVDYEAPVVEEKVIVQEKNVAGFWEFLSFVFFVALICWGMVFLNSLQEDSRSLCSEKNACIERCAILTSEINRKKLDLENAISQIPQRLVKMNSKLRRVDESQIMSVMPSLYMGKIDLGEKPISRFP